MSFSMIHILLHDARIVLVLFLMIGCGNRDFIPHVSDRAKAKICGDA